MAAGAGETTGRRTRGSSPETLRAQPREEPPVHAPPASPRRPEAPPPSGRGEGGGVVRGAVVPPAGPAARLMSSRVFRVLGPSGCCLERRGGSSRRRAAGPSFTDVHLCEALCRPGPPPRNGSYFWGADAGRSHRVAKRSGIGRRYSREK